MLLDGKDLKDLYDNVEFNKHVLQHGIENQIVSFIPYPPMNSLLLLPFARLEPLNAKLFWNVLNMIFFGFAIYFISRISGLNLFFTGCLFFISGYAFVNNFFFGQAYLLILFLFLGSLYFMLSERNILSALFFAASVLLKFYTIFFLILFLLRKKFKIVFTSILFLIAFNLIVFIATGWSLNLFYYSEIMPRISDGWVGTGYATEFQSILSFLHVLFYNEPSLNPNPLIESPELYFIIKYFFYVGILTISVYSILHFDNRDSNESFKLQVSLFCFVCMLLLPVNASYQYIILVPAVAILVKYYSDRKKYFQIILSLILFFLMNSPLTVLIVNVTKSTPWFFLGYVKLFILLYFWVKILLILREGVTVKAERFSKLNYIIAPLLVILILTRMSLTFFRDNDDGAKNVLNNSNYLISMPSVYEGKFIYTECLDNRFVLNSNFGFTYNKDNIFEPEFLNKDEIVYETFESGKKVFKKLNIVNLEASIITNSPRLRELLKYDNVACFSENGQIFVKPARDSISVQVTSGNSINTRPVFDKKNGKIIFCSDRNRGVGFTTLYEIILNK